MQESFNKKVSNIEWYTQDEMRASVAMKIRRENFFHGGVMPRDSAIYWNGYLAGCGAGGGISGADYWYLKGLLPEIENDPVPALCIERAYLPDDEEITQLEPLTIPQVVVAEQVLKQGALTSYGPVPITKPKFIDGRLNGSELK